MILRNSGFMKKAVLSLFGLMLIASLAAKPPYLRFKNIGVKDGLIHNDVGVVLEDKNQMLWVGTTHGLTRFDGAEFIPLNAKDTLTALLEKTFIMDLKADEAGNVWIASFGDGLFCYNLNSGKFSRFSHDKGDSLSLPTNEITHIAFDSYNNKWIATTKGLYLMKKDGERQLFQHEEGNDQSLAGDYLYRIFVDRRDEVWICSPQGVNRMIPMRNGQFQFRLYTKYTDVGKIPHNGVWTVTEGLDGKIWMGFIRGEIGAFDPEEETYTSYSSALEQKNGFPFCLLPDDRGNIWIGDMKRGLMKLNVANKTIEKIWRDRTIPSTLPNDDIKSVYKSPSGKWIVTHSSGFSYFHPGKKEFQWEAVANHAPDRKFDWSYAISFCEAGPDRLWVSSVEGIHLWDMKSGNWELKVDPVADLHLPGPRNFRELFQDSKGRLWVDTRLGGPIYWDTEKQQHRKFDVPTMGIIQEYLEDREGNVWFTVDGFGLSCLKAGADSLMHFSWPEFRNTIPKERFLKFVQVEDGTFWIGSYGQGLHQFDPRKGEFIQKIPYVEGKSDGLPDQLIQDLCSDGKEGLWIATKGGLSHFDMASKSFRNYSTRDGLPTNALVSVEIDNKGDLWIGTELGLTRFEVEKAQFRTFSQVDGISDHTFNHGQAARIGDQMVFLGSHGLTLFNPDFISPAPPLPKVVLTNFKILNKIVALDSAPEATNYIEIGHQDYAFTFEYTAPAGMEGENLVYACKLKGLDEDWIQMGKSKSASYTVLPPGEYTFMAKVWDPQNANSTDPLQVVLYIRPAFWQTTLFKAFMILLGLGLLLTIIWLGKRQLDIRHEKELAEQSAAYKSRFLANMSHEIRTPMHAVLSAAELLAESPLDEKQQRYLKHIRRAGSNLLNLINDILDFSKIEAGKLAFKAEPFSLSEVFGYVHKSLETLAKERNNDLHFFLPSHLPDKLIGDPGRLGQILLNLLSNAIKFTENGKIELIASIQEEEMKRLVLAFQIKDNGIGIPADQLSQIFESFVQGKNQQNLSLAGVGLGLAITRQLVEQQGGEISVQSEEGKGTVFSFFLPFEKALASAVQSPVQSPSPSGDLEIASILLVEDIALNRELASDMISKAFPHVLVHSAENGLEALKLLESISLPDIILMDVRMPEMDGLACTAHIRERYGAIVPVVALTASATESEIKRCFKRGMDAFLAKPFTPDQLVQIISETLSPAYSADELAINDEQLSHFLGHDKDRIARYLNSSRDEIFRHYRSLRVGIAQENWEGAQIAAHSLKTTFRYLGVVPLSDGFAKVEKALQVQEEERVLAEFRNLFPLVWSFWKEKNLEISR